MFLFITENKEGMPHLKIANASVRLALLFSVPLLILFHAFGT
jgi:hypothetical protein